MRSNALYASLAGWATMVASFNASASSRHDEGIGFYTDYDELPSRIRVFSTSILLFSRFRNQAYVLLLATLFFMAWAAQAPGQERQSLISVPNHDE